VVLAPAKINLHLEVLGLRPDGYHELAMVMQSIDLADRLHLRRREDGRIELSADHAGLPLDQDNLIVQAAEALRRHAGRGELGADIRLEKRIPIGAGLAGGSSDAAAALVGLEALWGLGLPRQDLHELAAGLGSDVPFCLEGGTVLCFGRGERLEPLSRRSLPPLAVLLVKHPQLSVSTPWAYRLCRERRGEHYLRDEEAFERRRRALRNSPLVGALQGRAPLPPIRNDLEAVVSEEVPGIATGMELLRRCGEALAVAMSGSGPSLFALFPDPAAAQRARDDLAAELDQAGFESWCCRFLPHGASLVE
jgi:4-diphosphocytidyl-2-C-methyl-D-erythritol kinase